MKSGELSAVKVLVTGATGFIGKKLAEVLAQRENAMVTGTGRKLEKASQLKDIGVKLLALDLIDQKELRQAFVDVKYVFHCAGALGGDKKKAELINVRATEEIVKAAAGAGVKRVVHISTVGVYDMKHSDVVEESTPLAPDHSSSYPRTKARGEKIAFETGKSHDIEVVALRPSMVYGPGDGVWTTMMYNNVCEGKPVFLGDGSYNFNPVYLDDVVEAIIKAATSTGVDGEAFNISSEVTTTWKTFMDYYGEACNKKPKSIPLFLAKAMAAANKLPGVNLPVDEGFIEMATSNKVFPIQKAEKLLHWKPSVSLSRGMGQTIRWLEQHSR